MHSDNARTIKVVINRSPSRLALSVQAAELFWSLKGNTSKPVDTEIKRKQRPITINDTIIRRSDPDLIATVERLGVKANANDVELEIVSIPECSDWYIGDVCGIEYVMAGGAVWPQKS